MKSKFASNEGKKILPWNFHGIKYEKESNVVDPNPLGLRLYVLRRLLKQNTNGVPTSLGTAVEQ